MSLEVWTRNQNEFIRWGVERRREKRVSQKGLSSRHRRRQLPSKEIATKDTHLHDYS